MRIFTEEQLVLIFEEWKRRHDANPADFSDETYPENYGKTVVYSIKAIAKDLGFLPIELDFIDDQPPTEVNSHG